MPFSWLVMLLTFGLENRGVVALSMFVAAFADPAAALIGQRFASEKTTFTLTSDRKSLPGSIAFFLISVLVIFLSPLFMKGGAIYLFQNGLPSEIKVTGAVPEHFAISVYLFLMAVAVSIVLTVFEAISSKGSDNLTVPIVGCLLFFVLLKRPGFDLLESLFFGILLGTIVAFLSYKFKFLTSDGAASAMLLASFVFGFGHLKWSLPMLTFFILSSLLSKLRKKVNESVDNYFEKTGVRDYMQVISNGGVGAILVLLEVVYGGNIFYLFYAAVLAAVCADTWATEIGTLYRAKTYNILTLKPVDQGISGGVSFSGTMGALMGSLIVAASAAYWLNFAYFCAIVFAGFSGSLLDSILGASLQVQFRCTVCNKQTERDFHCQKRTVRVKGLQWLNNDLVNLMAGFSGGILITLFQTFSGLK
ncbi:MAG: DUF92 domain-containing protein [Bacteroidota bacterium]|nr:DUF92 domain-containing protein [Bacteroidota bacterium]